MTKIAFFDKAQTVVSNVHVTISNWDQGNSEVPESIQQFLARLRLLDQVPFNNLVPDTELLPNESIRFFYLDRAWTDAIVQGALSVATRNEFERATLEKVYPAIEKAVDEAERLVRLPGGEPKLGGRAGQVTGFLMRSLAVAGWPGMHVRAYAKDKLKNDETIPPESSPDRIKILRLERLAPSVLLVLFDGVPELIHIEEPRQGLQFGANFKRNSNKQVSATVPARSAATGNYVVRGVESPTHVSKDADPIPVKFRANARGVIDLTNTAKAFVSAAGTDMASGGVDGAEFALQMIRFPYRQVFGNASNGGGDVVFKPSVKEIAESFEAILSDEIRRS